MDQADIAYETDNYARIYKLTRMKAYNALNQDMITSLSSKLRVRRATQSLEPIAWLDSDFWSLTNAICQTWRESDKCKVIIGMGSEKAFCAGGDVKRTYLLMTEKEQS